MRLLYSLIKKHLGEGFLETFYGKLVVVARHQLEKHIESIAMKIVDNLHCVGLYGSPSPPYLRG